MTLRSAARNQSYKLLALLEWLAPRNYQLQFSPTFVVGPPRGGSTLVRQLISWGLPTSHFTNLVGGSQHLLGRPLPVAGAVVVRWLHGPLPVDREYEADPFRNHYGQIAGKTAPAEGEVLWGHWFGTRYGPVDPEDLSHGRIRAMYRAVAATERIFGLPFVSKTSTLSLRIRALVHVFPTALFIRVARDPVDTAQSIVHARRSDYPEWLGARPRECDLVAEKSLCQQVCEQVYYTEQQISRAEAALGGNRFLRIHYQDVCERPEAELRRIAQFMTSGGAPVRQIRPLPTTFPFSHGRTLDQADYETLQRCFDLLARRDSAASAQNDARQLGVRSHG